MVSRTLRGPGAGEAAGAGVAVSAFRWAMMVAATPKPMSRGRRPLQQLARYRCRRDNYRWPVEMLFTRWLVPAQKLS